MVASLVLVRMHNQACPLFACFELSAQGGESRMPEAPFTCDRTYTCRYFSWPYLPLPQRTVPWEVAARQSPRSTRRRAAEPFPRGWVAIAGGDARSSVRSAVLACPPRQAEGEGGGKGGGKGKGGAAPFVLPPRFVYLPIRSAGSSEMCFERSYWEDDSTVATTFNVPVSSYREMPWTYQTAYLLEGLLSRGIPVAFNSDVHTRVAIAFDATHVLCLDR